MLGLVEHKKMGILLDESHFLDDEEQLVLKYINNKIHFLMIILLKQLVANMEFDEINTPINLDRE